MTLRAALVAAAAAAAFVVVSGCGAAPTPPALSSGRNPADVAYLQSMLPHHTQAIAISSQAPSRASSPEVKDLAARIDLSHAADVDEMIALLQSWGERRPQPGAAGPLPVPMVGPDQLDRLAATTGSAFDRMFLELMARQHLGPVDLARDEIVEGRDPRVVRLAEKIVIDQQAEAAEMQALLARV